eukprot:jgi/Mesvir1/22616/Mv14060-RA.2
MTTYGKSGKSAPRGFTRSSSGCWQSGYRPRSRRDTTFGTRACACCMRARPLWRRRMQNALRWRHASSGSRQHWQRRKRSTMWVTLCACSSRSTLWVAMHACCRCSALWAAHIPLHMWSVFPSCVFICPVSMAVFCSLMFPAFPAVAYALHAVACALHAVACALHAVACALHAVACALHVAACALHAAACALHAVACALHAVACALHAVACALHAVACALHAVACAPLRIAFPSRLHRAQHAVVHGACLTFRPSRRRGCRCPPGYDAPHVCPPGHQRCLVGGVQAVAQEALEMRTKLALKGQEAAQQEADHRELLQRLQAALRERDALRAEKAQLLEERETNREHMSRQTEVISQLMERNEAMSRDKVESLKLASKTESDNHVLRVNLGQHGQVVEKLIHLNAELMEEKNARTVAKVREAAPDAATQQGGGEMGQQGAAVGADASSWPHTHDPPRPGQGTAAAPGNAQGRSITGHNPSANKGAKSTQPLAPNGHAGAHPSGEQLSDRRVVEIGSDDEPLLPPSVPAGATTPPLSQGRWAGGLSAVANGWMGSRGVGAPVGAGGADVAVSTEAGARSLVGAAKVDRDGQGGAATKGLDLEAGAAGQTQRVANPVTHPRPIKWTSDALPLLRQNQPQGGVMGDRDGTDSEGSGRGAGAMGNLDPRLDAAWSKVKVVKQGVAGKTRGLMSYIVGADVAQSVN